MKPGPTLHTADHVVILCVGTLTKRSGSTRSVDYCLFTHLTTPKAWYSITAERLMRPRRPCCIPRSKRTMATFGDGCFWYLVIKLFTCDEARPTNSISTGTLRTHNQGMRILMMRISTTPGQGTEIYSQRSHAHGIPEILLAENVLYAHVPCLGVGVVRIAENGEQP